MDSPCVLCDSRRTSHISYSHYCLNGHLRHHSQFLNPPLPRRSPLSLLLHEDNKKLNHTFSLYPIRYNNPIYTQLHPKGYNYPQLLYYTPLKFIVKIVIYQKIYDKNVDLSEYFVILNSNRQECHSFTFRI